MKRIFLTIISLTIAGLCANGQTADTANSVVKCAQAGNDTCQNRLGKWLYEGSHGYQKDPAKAAQWWLQAAKQNNSEATANLGFCYMYGTGVDRDSSTASRLFEKAIKMGNKHVIGIHDSLARRGTVFSAMLLAHCHRVAIGVERNERTAVRYYLMAAAKGNVEAMREAAILKRSAKEDREALDLFRKAMEKGDVVATYYYGKMLCEGRGAAKDASKGVACLSRAAEKDYPAAQYELANAYANGTGVRADEAQAFRWYTQAAMGGNRAAWWERAERLRLGKGVSMDYEAALECYTKAYGMGYNNKLKALLAGDNQEWKETPFMQYLHAVRLLEVDNDPNAAKAEFAKLSKQMPAAKTMEAVCMLHPAFKKANVKKAVKELQKRAATDQRAAFELAMLQIAGNGVEKDVAKAEKTLNTMAGNGYWRAVNYLADCYYEGCNVAKNKDKAILLYLRAERQQCLTTGGATRLAQAFRNGEGMKADTGRAEKLEKYKATESKALLELVKK